MLSPFLPEGMLWQDASQVLEMLTLEDIKEAVADPQRFLSSFSSRLGPVAHRWALASLRPHVEPLLKPLSLEELRVDLDLDVLRAGANRSRVLVSAAVSGLKRWP